MTITITIHLGANHPGLLAATQGINAALDRLVATLGIIGLDQETAEALAFAVFPSPDGAAIERFTWPSEDVRDAALDALSHWRTEVEGAVHTALSTTPTEEASAE